MEERRWIFCKRSTLNTRWPPLANNARARRAQDKDVKGQTPLRDTGEARFLRAARCASIYETTARYGSELI